MFFSIKRTVRHALFLGTLLATLGTDLVAEEAVVQVYECHQGGKVTFSDAPCAGVEQSVDVDFSRSGGAPSEAAAGSVQAEEEQAGAVAQANLLDAEIQTLQQQITNLETERDARVAALRDKLAQGTEKLDVNAWTDTINQEIARTYQGYGDSIDASRARLGKLQVQRQALGGQ